MVVLIGLAVTLISMNGNGDDPRTLTVCAKDITLRPEPRSHAVLAELLRGERVKVLDSAPNWVKVETSDGRRGWAVVDFLGTSC